MSCGAESNTIDPFLDLSLELQGPDGVGVCRSLSDALTRFTRPEFLEGDNGYWCARTGTPPAHASDALPCAIPPPPCSVQCACTLLVCCRHAPLPTTRAGSTRVHLSCEACKATTRAQKQFRIANPPRVLTLHLKRFSFGSSNAGTGYYHVRLAAPPPPPSASAAAGEGGGGASFVGLPYLSRISPPSLARAAALRPCACRAQARARPCPLQSSGSGKISAHIAFDPLMNVAPFTTTPRVPVGYRLYGVLIHEGSSTSSGHYYAYSKAHEPSDASASPAGATESGWYGFNDAHVRAVPESEVLAAAAYILFYERIGSRRSTASPTARLGSAPAGAAGETVGAAHARASAPGAPEDGNLPMVAPRYGPAAPPAATSDEDTSDRWGSSLGGPPLGTPAPPLTDEPHEPAMREMGECMPAGSGAAGEAAVGQLGAQRHRQPQVMIPRQVGQVKRATAAAGSNAAGAHAGRADGADADERARPAQVDRPEASAAETPTVGGASLDTGGNGHDALTGHDAANGHVLTLDGHVHVHDAVVDSCDAGGDAWSEGGNHGGSEGGNHGDSERGSEGGNHGGSEGSSDGGSEVGNHGGSDDGSESGSQVGSFRSEAEHSYDNLWSATASRGVKRPLDTPPMLDDPAEQGSAQHAGSRQRTSSLAAEPASDLAREMPGDAAGPAGSLAAEPASAEPAAAGMMAAASLPTHADSGNVVDAAQALAPAQSLSLKSKPLPTVDVDVHAQHVTAEAIANVLSTHGSLQVAPFHQLVESARTILHATLRSDFWAHTRQEWLRTASAALETLGVPSLDQVPPGPERDRMYHEQLAQLKGALDCSEGGHLQVDGFRALLNTLDLEGLLDPNALWKSATQAAIAAHMEMEACPEASPL